MSTYIEIEISGLDETAASLLIARLSDTGVEGFEEVPGGLKGFWPEASFSHEEVTAILGHHPFVLRTIGETNWNALWESNFHPVVIGSFAAIRAFFHEPIPGVQHELVITPKMSFGTGHHATTHMMIAAMEQISFQDKEVFDFGTGTGVLAILAARLGASRILAIDNDDWSIENAIENAQRNAVDIVIRKGTDARTGETFDIILANINRHILIGNMEVFRQSLKPGGTLLVSGLLTEDRAVFMESAGSAGFRELDSFTKHNWLAIKLSH